MYMHLQPEEPAKPASHSMIQTISDSLKQLYPTTSTSASPVPRPEYLFSDMDSRRAGQNVDVKQAMSALRGGDLFERQIEDNPSLSAAVRSSEEIFSRDLESAYRAARWTRWRKGCAVRWGRSETRGGPADYPARKIDDCEGTMRHLLGTSRVGSREPCECARMGHAESIFGTGPHCDCCRRLV